MKQRLLLSLLIPIFFLSSGCTAIAVTGAAVGGAVAVTGAAVKTTGAAVGAVIPDGDDEEDEEKAKK